MEKIINNIEYRCSLLNLGIRKAERDLKNQPAGRLRISTSNKQTRYYHVRSNGDMSGTYIKKENRGLVKDLAQKEYAIQFLKHAKSELIYWDKVKIGLSKHNADLTFRQLIPQRQSLVSPYIIDDAEYAKAWQRQNLQTNAFYVEEKKIMTARGEKVRSKSEALIADILAELGIPYHYEAAIRLGNRHLRYPDFTLLDIRTREEIYLEHFGMLDREEYRVRALSKMNEYMENGIFLGVNLLVTFETSDAPLDTKYTRAMLARFFGKE